MSLRRALAALALAAPLAAQVPPAEVVALAALGEFHFGAAPVPGDLKALATDGAGRSLGWALPLALAPRWELRPRYDDGRWSGAYGQGGASVGTLVKQRHLGLDLLFCPAGERRAGRPGPYLGAGLGLMQTWHERHVNGVLTAPGLPAPAAEESFTAAFRVVAGLRATAWLSLEVQAQTSSHTFQGVRFQDATVTAGLRFWPAALAFGAPRRR